MMIETIFTHRPRISFARFLLCWWRHNRLLMTSQSPDSCGANTWIISNAYRFYSRRYSRPAVYKITICHSLSIAISPDWTSTVTMLLRMPPVLQITHVLRWLNTLQTVSTSFTVYCVCWGFVFNWLYYCSSKSFHLQNTPVVGNILRTITNLAAEFH